MSNNADDAFNDIEMLDIPDSISDTDSISDKATDATPSTSSHTDDNLSTASSSSTSTGDSNVTEPEYVSLKDWLVDPKQYLDFHLDAKRLRRSLIHATTDARFANDLYKTFEDLLDTNIVGPMASDGEDEPADDVIGVVYANMTNKARKRHHHLNVALNKIITAVAAKAEDVDDETSQRYQTLLSVLECLQANYFYDDIIARPNMLTNWINKSDPLPDPELVEAIMIQTPKPYLHPLFWNTYVAQLLVRGLTRQAVNALERSKFEADLFQTNAVLLDVIYDFKNLLGSYVSMSHKHQFNDWKLTCCEFRDSIPSVKLKMTADTDNQHFIILSQIYDLAGVLTGLPKTIASFCNTWYELFTALSLYQVPHDETLYKEYFEVASTEKPARTIEDNTVANWDAICFNVLEEHFLKVLGSIDELDRATSTYISVILEQRGLLANYYQNKSLLISRRTISEYLVTKYAYDCLNEYATAPIGVGLLLKDAIFRNDEDIKHNRKTVAEFLPKFECKTNDDLEWCLTICATLNLETTAQKLYLKYGEKSLKDGYLFEAMNMFVNCETPTGINPGMAKIHHIIWDLIFQDALLNNRPIRDDLISNIVNKKVDADFDIHPVIRQCLSPYAVLCEFLEPLPESADDEDLASKLSKLRHLLRFEFMPQKFYPLLLCQYLPFLLDYKYRFQLPDLIVIIELIDQFEPSTNEHDDSDALYKYSVEHIETSAAENDWRLYLKNNNIDSPGDVESVIKLLRNEIAARIGRVYIDNNNML